MIAFAIWLQGQPNNPQFYWPDVQSRSNTTTCNMAPINGICYLSIFMFLEREADKSVGVFESFKELIS